MAGAVILVTAGGAALALYPRSPKPSAASPSPRRPGFIPPRSAAEETPTAPAAPPLDEQVAGVMQAWRAAILGHDPDVVMACDRTFVTDSKTFTPALVKSARTDPDVRVRAFSTRVLGKLGDASLIDVFRELLQDQHPFVRENAAWSLGELQERASGLGPDLERLRRRDKAESVRRAALEALQKVHRGRGAPGSAG